MRKLSLTFLLSVVAASAAEVYTFSLLPPSGSIDGAPGTTIGWGYALQNHSSALWLVPVNLNAGVFANSTHELLFDFPILAPATSVAKSFDPSKSVGLFELTWNPSAPVGFSNTGTFTLDAQWWSGDPLASGVFVSGAPSIGVLYTATVVPEPGTIGPMAVLGLGLLAASVHRAARFRPGRCRRS